MDVNGDGVLEVIVVGNVYDCGADPYESLYEMPYIFNADRSRWQYDGFDWLAIPTPDGDAEPLSENWNDIENNQPNPVVADLDGDGFMEILHSSYDGRVHAYWLDKTEHGNWPYSVYSAGEGFHRFASEPVVADLDDNGRAEVLFASWVEKETYHTGKLHILDYLGNPIHEEDLPPPSGGKDWNGALGAPTLDNVDDDADLEVVLGTAHSGVVVFDLPGTSQARILWGTGRANYQRSGSSLHGTLQASSKTVEPRAPSPGQVLTYTIRLENPGPTLHHVRVSDTLPIEVEYLGNLWATSGSYGAVDGGTGPTGRTLITWTGSVSTFQPVTITYGATISDQLLTPAPISNAALIVDDLGYRWERQALVIVGAHCVYLPLVQRHHE
jgi:uncharacterized repeat protein (TIGR01451 family)